MNKAAGLHAMKDTLPEVSSQMVLKVLPCGLEAFTPLFKSAMKRHLARSLKHLPLGLGSMDHALTNLET